MTGLLVLTTGNKRPAAAVRYLPAEVRLAAGAVPQIAELVTRKQTPNV